MESDTETEEPMRKLERKEKALSGLKDALSGLESVPAVGLDSEKHEKIRSMGEQADSLERALTNEVEQLRKQRNE